MKATSGLVETEPKTSKHTETTAIEKWRLLLQALPFFKVFNNDELEEMLRVCETKRYRQFETIIKEKETSNSSYIILKGEVTVKKDTKSAQAKFTVGVLKQGSFFGEGQLLLNQPCSASVMATSDAYLFKITNENINKLKPETSRKFFRQLAADIFKRLIQSSEIIAK